MDSDRVPQAGSERKLNEEEESDLETGRANQRELQGRVSLEALIKHPNECHRVRLCDDNRYF